MYLDRIIGGQLGEEGVIVVTAVTEAVHECNMGFGGFGGLGFRLVGFSITCNRLECPRLKLGLVVASLTYFPDPRVDLEAVA
jgi:hypothetical protein